MGISGFCSQLFLQPPGTMSALPPKLIDCPNCGNVNRLSGWDGRSDWRCQNCGLVLPRATSLDEDRESHQPSGEPSRAPANSPAAPDIRRKLKRWTDVHRLPSPEDLEATDPGIQAPEWLTRPVVPPPSPKHDIVSNAGLPMPPLTERSPSEEPSIPAEDEAGQSIDWELDYDEEFLSKIHSSPQSGGEGQNRGSRLPRAILLFGMLLLVFVIGWLVHSTLHSRDRWTDAPEPQTQRTALEAREDWRKLVLPLVKRFAKASTPEEWGAMVRDPERVAPLILTFKPKFATGRPLGIKPFGSEPFGDGVLYQFSVTYEDGRSRLIHVLPTADGPKVDWESFARSGGAGFEELTGPVPVEAELRVLVKPAMYYNYNFSDDRQWRAYETMNGDWPDPLTGYAQVGSTAANALLRMAGQGLDDSPARFILKVRGGGEDGARGQLEILEVVQKGWVKP